MKVAIIGLGRMGRGIAKNLVNKGYEVEGFDIDKNLYKLLSDLKGFKPLNNISDAHDSDYILLLLPTGKEVIDVIKALKDYKGIIIDMTTMGYDEINDVINFINNSGLNYISAKIERGPADAEAGRLVFYVGGNKKLYEKSKNLLNDMGEHIYLESNENANIIKLISTLLLTANTILLAEISQIADKLKIDKDLLVKALSMGGADSVQLRSRFPMMINKNYKEIFSIKLGKYVAEKTLEYLNDYGINYTPVLRNILDVLKLSNMLKIGDKDIAEISEFYKKVNNDKETANLNF
ncbi:MAG: NAD(P)-dependent oxidoreductase [Caldisphaera sp.]|jgi:3-hydroxyisobutyrate dehydrogenase and related beta-hydroxyacid dehydrogenases|uniref:NAD(P)-dependent oxidoreductase n=1 Tax=Caldisphaera sp. TaxID=2060322 RepID=UPI003978C8E1